MYSASEWIFPDLWRFINVLITIIFAGPAYNVDTAAHFIQTMFLHQVRSRSKVVYPHFTTATDTSNIQVVFQVVMDTIIKDNIAAVQLL